MPLIENRVVSCKILPDKT
ncbi:hypothetical protein JL09_g6063 [Pichia kudriavzevii]|uniref:Uncharacterized protein n=1 Tax=Pichia kudriavzevii TaxID=4909 RepID=A0A099NPR7_PICKU|nr:hypothetical protein JL09_g6063 [Pichia kudriavzevii]